MVQGLVEGCGARGWRSSASGTRKIYTSYSVCIALSKHFFFPLSIPLIRIEIQRTHKCFVFFG